MRKTIVTAAILAAAALTTTAATASTAGTEHLSLINISTSESHLYSAVATGAFTAGGTAIVSDHAADITLRFPTGTIRVTAAQGHVNTTTNAACLLAEASSGTYKIIGGTGAYKGISGSGTTTAAATLIGAMIAEMLERHTSDRRPDSRHRDRDRVAAVSRGVTPNSAPLVPNRESRRVLRVAPRAGQQAASKRGAPAGRPSGAAEEAPQPYSAASSHQ